jgi:hypothetical protein
VCPAAGGGRRNVDRRAQECEQWLVKTGRAAGRNRREERIR